MRRLKRTKENNVSDVKKIWAVEHLSLRPTSKTTLFPRIIMWTDVEGGFIKIAEAFKRNKLVDASDEDRQHDVVLQAMNDAEGGFRHLENHNFEPKNLLIEHEMLLAQKKKFQKQISFVEHEVKILKNLAVEKMVMMTNQSVGERTKKEVVGNPSCLTTPVGSVPLRNKDEKQPDKMLLQ